MRVRRSGDDPMGAGEPGLGRGTTGLGPPPVGRSPAWPQPGSRSAVGDRPLGTCGKLGRAETDEPPAETDALPTGIDGIRAEAKGRPGETDGLRAIADGTPA